MTSRKRIGKRTEPSLTPILTAKVGEVVLPTWTDECTLLPVPVLTRLFQICRNTEKDGVFHCVKSRRYVIETRIN